MDTSSLDAAVKSATVAIAGQMQVVLTQSNPLAAHEYDMRTAMRHALNIGLPRLAIAEASVQPPIMASTVDVGVPSVDPAGDPRWDALFELKWWSSPSNQVDDAIKDLVKLATYRMLGATRTAYLVAAGSSDTWHKPSSYGYYPRLWDDRVHNLPELIAARLPYAETLFKPPSKYPPSAPQTIVTTRIAEVPIHLVSSQEWVLRCARVEPGEDPTLHHFTAV